jgi:hypothetical protein
MLSSCVDGVIKCLQVKIVKIKEEMAGFAKVRFVVLGSAG